MSSVLDQPTSERRERREGRDSTITSAPAQQLRLTMAAVRVCFTWLGVRKTLSPEQKELAAESFGAEGAFLSAGKKLLDTSHPAYKAVTAVRHRVVAYWKGVSLPFPEAGVRLIRQSDLAAFDVQMTTHRQELDEAVRSLDRHYAELKSAARQRLGSLYNAGDYPQGLLGMFGLAWEFPAVEPPDYLRQLSPALFEEESRRVAGRFDEALRLAEEAFATELSRLVSHLAERLAGQEGGRPKIFRDSAIDNFREFFDRFRTLNVRSNEELDRLVEQAQLVLRGVEPRELRTSQTLREDVAADMTRVQTSLDQWLTDRPRRNILRSRRRQQQEQTQ